MKYIREGRMGPPMSYKTGAVVSSYPRPLLVLNFQEGGLDVIKEQIEYLTPAQLVQATGAPYSGVTSVNFVRPATLDMTYFPGSSLLLDEVVKVLNHLKSLEKPDVPYPWKTVVLDPITQLTDIVLGHLTMVDKDAHNSALRWAPMAGGKVYQIIGFAQSLPCHVVTIMHSNVDKVTITTGKGKDATETIIDIREEPLLPGAGVRTKLNGIFSQFFYAMIEQGKPIIVTQPIGFIKGVGAKWPADLKMKIGPLFKDIYGSEAL